MEPRHSGDALPSITDLPNNCKTWFWVKLRDCRSGFISELVGFQFEWVREPVTHGNDTYANIRYTICPETVPVFAQVLSISKWRQIVGVLKRILKSFSFFFLFSKIQYFKTSIVIFIGENICHFPSLKEVLRWLLGLVWWCVLRSIDCQGNLEPNSCVSRETRRNAKRKMIHEKER